MTLFIFHSLHLPCSVFQRPSISSYLSAHLPPYLFSPSSPYPVFSWVGGKRRPRTFSQETFTCKGTFFFLLSLNLYNVHCLFLSAMSYHRGLSYTRLSSFNEDDEVCSRTYNYHYLCARGRLHRLAGTFVLAVHRATP